MAVLTQLVCLVEPPSVNFELINPVGRHLLEIIKRFRIFHIAFAAILATVAQGRCRVYDISRRGGVLHAAMVSEHPVEDYVKSTVMGFCHKLAKVILSSEMRVDLEIVVGEISRCLEFLASVSLRAVENRRQPYGIGAKTLYMVERINHPFEISVFRLSRGSPQVVVAYRSAGVMDERAYHYLVDSQASPVLGRLNLSCFHKFYLLRKKFMQL